jgi:tetratricopeptide (TPR) repeat protein
MPAAPARAQVFGAGPGRFVDIVELSDHDDQADIVVMFTCSMRYLTHQPASEGTELRIQLLPQGDCLVQPGTQIAAELPPLSGGANIITAVRIDSDVPGQATLAFTFKKSERYVVAQGVDPRSIRLRLIDRARGRGKVMINEPSEGVSNYAINLESQPKEFEPAAIQRARDRLKTQVFVSQAVVDGQTWFRLRAGPVDKRSDADRLLNQALADYPRAWLAIGDDSATTTTGGTAEALPAVEHIGADPALDPAALAALVSQARAAMNARDYPKAIAALTKLQRQPEFPQRAAMQELLGLARERASQLAHAKAEYEEYLRRYPTGEAAERVTRRLAVLRAASTQARTGSGGGSATTGWNVSGGVGQMYRYDGTTISNSNSASNGGNNPAASQTQKQNALYNDVDVLARRRGERFDMLARVSAGYAKNFAGTSATANSDSTKRISVASFEVADRTLRLLARVGRQSRNEDGVLGAFDGIFTSWQALRSLGVNVTYGYPVEQTSAGIQKQRRFWAVALPFAIPGAHWDASAFYTQQTFDGIKDRTAAGFEARVLLPRSSLTALVDYDTYFKSLNAAALLGTLQLPDRWNLSFDMEKRNAPVITARNALIGQPFTTIAQLRDVATDAEIYQWAIDRTAVSSNYSITATRPLGQRFQFATTITASEIGATRASGGVPDQAATGLNYSYQTQIYGSNIWRNGDFNVLSLAYATTEVGKIASIGVTSRMPLSGAWRIGPRLNFDRRELASDGSVELSVLPSVLIDYQRGRRLLQFEMGGQLGKRDSSQQTQQTQKTTRYYASLAYRIGF